MLNCLTLKSNYYEDVIDHSCFDGFKSESNQ